MGLSVFIANCLLKEQEQGVFGKLKGVGSASESSTANKIHADTNMTVTNYCKYNSSAG